MHKRESLFNELFIMGGAYHEYSRGKVLKQQKMKQESVHEIFNNVVCATSKASDQPAHMCSLIRAFASRLSIL